MSTMERLRPTPPPRWLRGGLGRVQEQPAEHLHYDRRTRSWRTPDELAARRRVAPAPVAECA